MKPCLSFAISSYEGSPYLNGLLENLKAQSLYPQFEVRIGVRRSGESLSALRNRLYAQAASDWVYFIDDDCRLPDDAFVERLLPQLSPARDVCYSGYYLGGTGFWQKAYNRLVNGWLHAHQEQGSGLPVAGNFVLGKWPFDPFPKECDFGGEEIGLAHHLRRRAIRFELRPEFSVVHDGQRTLQTFFRRAWRHGRAPYKPLRKVRAGRRFLKQTLHDLDVRLGLAMAAYMITVWLARLAPRRNPLDA